jgi:hypothetical protein
VARCRRLVPADPSPGDAGADKRVTEAGRRRSHSSLILKRVSASRSSGEWNDDDYDVLADGVVVRIMKAAAAEAAITGNELPHAAASGHAAAPPPRSVMKSRRPMQAVI